MISVLFGASGPTTDPDRVAEPSCFGDLNLDQVVAAVVAPKKDYRLAGYFKLPLDDVDAVNRRQAVFQDLEREPVSAVLAEFATGMKDLRDRLHRAGSVHYALQKQRWFLDAALGYCQTLRALDKGMSRAEPQAGALREVSAYVRELVGSSSFTQLHDEAVQVRAGLDALRYAVWVKGGRVTIGGYDDEPDYSAEVTRTFARFRQDLDGAEVKKRRSWGEANHIEARILNALAEVFPDQFAAVTAFCGRHDGFVDSTVEVLDREIQFYVAYLDHIAPLKSAGLSFSYPQVSADCKAENARDTFDLALATQLVGRDRPVVCNDIRLDGAERILVVSGPNNGGKTTMARTFGQLHHLARLGCPVPGRDVRLFLCDAVYTHFEVEEDIATLAGKLQEELDRMHADLERATSRSVIIMNEMFSSTSVADTLFLCQEMLHRISSLDALGVCVTFLDELSVLDDKTVSMVSTVDPDDPATRTLRVIRRPADGRAYARALAERYGLTYETLRKRVDR